jgi:phospholipid transport system transporter-binding protein
MIEIDGDVARVSGQMTIDSANALLASGCDAIAANARTFDLTAVTEVDSSGLAVMFAWMREAKSRNLTLTFANSPSSIGSLASVYDVVDLLPRH